MIKNSFNKIWFFDIEWAPDPDVGRRLYPEAANKPDAEAVAEMWRQAGGTDERPQPFVKTALCRIVSIAFLQRVTKDSAPTFSLHSLPAAERTMSEGEIIEAFLEEAGKKEPQLVGYNSAESDFNILIQRGMANEIGAHRFCRRPRERWSDERDYFGQYSECHLDLLKAVTGWKRGSKPSLHEMATACGFPGKIDVNGKQIADLWLENNLEQIIAYNECDVLTTYLLWLRMAKFSGLVSEKAYFDELKTFKIFLADESSRRGHLKKFLNKWRELDGTKTHATSSPN